MQRYIPIRQRPLQYETGTNECIALRKAIAQTWFDDVDDRPRPSILEVDGIAFAQLSKHSWFVFGPVPDRVIGRAGHKLHVVEDITFNDACRRIRAFVHELLQTQDAMVELVA